MPPMGTSSALRPLLPSDLPTIDAWLRDYVAEHRAWWTEAFGAEPGTPLAEAAAAEREDLVRFSERDDHLVRVLAGAADGAPLGVVLARVRQDRYMGLLIGQLAWIYVAPAARGSGASARLMDAAEAWFVERGAAGREVFVTAANARAVGVYERHGYRVVDYRMLKGG